MNYRTLGKTNLKVSEVGYGTWQLANDAACWVGATREESEKSLLTALDKGCNFIDTARAYGDGLSEQWIGEILKLRPQKEIVILSKMHPKNWQWPARKGADIQEVFPKEHIISQVEGSLKALNREFLDIMLFHVWQDDWAKEDEWKETIQKLTKEGKVKYWGISTNNHEAANCIKACDTGFISVVETIFNLFDQSPIDDFFPYARKNTIGFIARVPLDEGGLTGTLNSSSVFSTGDFRKKYFTKERLVELEKRIKALQPFITGDISSLAELALRFILSFREVSTVIPGMRKTTHVVENMQLSEKPKLSQEVLSELKKHAWLRDFYAGSWEE